MPSVRTARPEDIDTCAGLLELLFSQEHEFVPDRQKQLSGLDLIIRHPDSGTVLVCEKDGAIIGMVVLLFIVSTALGKKVALLEDLVIAPGHRGLGLGSVLLDAACDHAAGRGLGRITLLTDHDNILAHTLYAKKGFVRSDMVVFRRFFGA